MSGPHVVRARWAFTCSECLEEFPADSPMVVWQEELARNPLTQQPVRGQTKHLCEGCGKLLLESL